MDQLGQDEQACPDDGRTNVDGASPEDEHRVPGAEHPDRPPRGRGSTGESGRGCDDTDGAEHEEQTSPISPVRGRQQAEGAREREGADRRDYA